MQKAIGFLRFSVGVVAFSLGIAIGVAVHVMGESRLVSAAGITQGTADGLYVNETGDTMSGVLVVPNATEDGHAVNRVTADGRFVNTAGDTVTGALVVQNATEDGHALNRVTGDGRYIEDSEKGAANGVASLNGASHVVENPVSASVIPLPDKIPISDISGLLDGWVTYTPGGIDVPVIDGGTGESTATAAFDALSPLFVKGDIGAYSTTNVRVAVGTDGQFLTANSGVAAGVSWGDIPTVKSGTVAGGSFAGNPKVYTVTFSTAFPDTNYAVTTIGEDNRTLTFQTKLAGSFVINTNANLAIAGDVDWTATAHNDP